MVMLHNVFEHIQNEINAVARKKFATMRNSDRETVKDTSTLSTCTGLASIFGSLSLRTGDRCNHNGRSPPVK